MQLPFAESFKIFGSAAKVLEVICFDILQVSTTHLLENDDIECPEQLELMLASETLLLVHCKICGKYLWRSTTFVHQNSDHSMEEFVYVAKFPRSDMSTDTGRGPSSTPGDAMASTYF